ncbi:MAG: flavin monoamine oxidase family protein [bacterium]
MNIPSPERLREVLNGGLPRPAEETSVLVIGAGMAGLVAATELLHAGYKVTVLEGQQRVGGRVFTLREPFTEGLYAEAGAMRIPRAHDLTLHYVHKFGLTTKPFTMGNPKAWTYIHGHKVRMGEFSNALHATGFELAEEERMYAVVERWGRTLQPLFDRIKGGGPDAWSEIARELDQFSLHEFLENRGWSQGAIELYCLFSGMEPFLNSAFMEILREEAGDWFSDVTYIAGGMDQLPRAFLPELLPRIHFGRKVTAISQDAEGVRATFQGPAGRGTISADRAIIALPFPVLRHIEITPAVSTGKQRAIRQLHYDAASKVFLQSRTRFWETNDGIVGGGTVTDLPIRQLYYPDHGKQTGRGVLLASYTWSEDAQRWGSLSPADRLTQAIENVAVIHPEIRHNFEVGASKMWHDDEFAGGAYALFDPGQQTHLFSHILSPEGRLFFAGEHASLAHGWIQGAIESGLRAAIEVAG